MHENRCGVGSVSGHRMVFQLCKNELEEINKSLNSYILSITYKSGYFLYKVRHILATFRYFYVESD